MATKLPKFPDLAEMSPEGNPPYFQSESEGVTRFEVIDHTGRIPDKVGRILSMRDVKIELSYQDNGRTLKIFVDERK